MFPLQSPPLIFHLCLLGLKFHFSLMSSLLSPQISARFKRVPWFKFLSNQNRKDLVPTTYPKNLYIHHSKSSVVAALYSIKFSERESENEGISVKVNTPFCFFFWYCCISITEEFHAFLNVWSLPLPWGFADFNVNDIISIFCISSNFEIIAISKNNNKSKAFNYWQ